MRLIVVGSTSAYSGRQLRLVEPSLDGHDTVDLHDGHARSVGGGVAGLDIDVHDLGLRREAREHVLGPLAEMTAAAGIEHDPWA